MTALPEGARSLRPELALFLCGLGFRHDESGRFVIEKPGHGVILSVVVGVGDGWTSVEMFRPDWVGCPDGGERWFRHLVRDLSGRDAYWVRNGSRANARVPNSRAMRFLQTWVLQEFGWSWHAMARVARKEG